MAGSFNRIVIVGNLGRDPEPRSLPNGDPVADLSVATNERRRGPDGQMVEQTTWFRVNVFGRLAEIAGQYLHKGSLVYVEGSLTQREYTGNDGQTRLSLEVRARDLQMLDRKDEGAPALVGAGVGSGEAGDSGDLPF